MNNNRYCTTVVAKTICKLKKSNNYLNVFKKKQICLQSVYYVKAMDVNIIHKCKIFDKDIYFKNE